MVFNNLLFIFVFLPVLLISQLLIKNTSIRNLIIILFSFVFYSWLNPASFILLILYILWNYFTALEIETSTGNTRTFAFVLGVAVQILVLCLYKYVNFIFSFTDTIHFDVTVPMGVSFFTFSCISYLADVYTTKSKASKNILHVALYISFFGKISMGPIVQYKDMEQQLDNHPVTAKLVGTGLQLFIIGLIKKVILADSLSLLHADLATSSSVLGAWLYAISYMLQIYFDFSGYSDMAIGVSNMVGFTFNKNFDYPYIATSIQDFWRRWHISLSRWFRDYIYIPLGGNRVQNAKYIRNIFVVWALTGIWHGANFTFIVWGLYFGVLLLLEKFFLNKYLKKLPSFITRIYTLLLVLISWIFFMSNTLGDAFSCISQCIGIGSTGLIDMHALFALRSNLVLLVVSMIFCTPIYEKIEHYIFSKGKEYAIIPMVVVYIFMFVVVVAYIVSSTFTSFLYFAF